VFLLEPDPTPFDLRFRIFGVPVRVSPWFWVLSAVLGWRFFDRGGVGLLGLWVGCVFVSILIHELGHVAAFRWFGVPSHVVLYPFGGLAIPTHEPPHRSDRIIVALAGPAAQLVLYALVRVADVTLLGGEGQSPLLGVAVGMLLFINLYWPL